MTDTMEPFYVDNGTPAPPDVIRFSAVHATNEDCERTKLNDPDVTWQLTDLPTPSRLTILSIFIIIIIIIIVIILIIIVCLFLLFYSADVPLSNKQTDYYY